MPSDATKLSNHLFLSLTALVGILLLYPFLDYLPWLSQGDHGLNLYASQAVLDGLKPYRDFHWFYGPLMPYIYGLFQMIAGETVESILLAKVILILVSGLCVYISLSLFIPRTLALIAAIWFWTGGFDFPYTFNHTGGLTLILFIIVMLCWFIKLRCFLYLNVCLIGCFALSLVKLNIGLSTLTGLICSLLIIDIYDKDLPVIKKRWFYVNACILTPLCIALAHWYFIFDQPFYVIRQCFQYFGTDAFSNTSLGIGMNLLYLSKFYAQRVFANWNTIFFWVIIIISFIYSLVLIKKRVLEPHVKRSLILVSFAIIIIYVLNLHEYMLSGVLFRTYWSESLSLLLSFLLIGTVARHYSHFVRRLLFFVLLSIALIQYTPLYYQAKNAHNPQQLLFLDKAKVYVGNEPQWVDTVTQTTMFLERNLQDNELFFALPYEPLYYFLTDRPSPTRQLIFFDFLQIPPEQEASILKELENNRVNWVVLSNRMRSDDPSASGILGQTYCPLIGQYLQDNFEIAQTFGQWNSRPSWAWNHSVRILRRK